MTLVGLQRIECWQLYKHYGFMRLQLAPFSTGQRCSNRKFCDLLKQHNMSDGHNLRSYQLKYIRGLTVTKIYTKGVMVYLLSIQTTGQNEGV